ncbi:helix-turn-helix domain-containing protein [Halanaerobium sp. MA284_MarDTE_T2]|uniref:helix-turn-helix domain-containing protein n=1 Tax=Halanaerobium sp. MA284_MarDTE_T2 TaxID=2183913 RepID=UPI000DF22BA7|nr:helix-turn-helix domain-containing protein [Halanaerobium sp. MA284_MarDTE_T2]RCW49766.1 excisionase family DNA binding protein [Halanaerobium sp. MA284_MarDTE_T2]
MKDTKTDLIIYFKNAVKEQINFDFEQIPFSLGVSDLKELLPLSDSKIYMMLESGEIPARKIGGKWTVSRPEFLAWFFGSEEDLDLSEQVFV